MKRGMIQMLIVGVVLAFSLTLCLAEEPEEKDKPEFAKVNSPEAIAGFKPLEKELVSCLKLTPKKELMGKHDSQVELKMEIDETGKITHVDSSISFPGGIKVLPCFMETVHTVKFPPTGKKCKQVYRFKMDPYLKKDEEK